MKKALCLLLSVIMISVFASQAFAEVGKNIYTGNIIGVINTYAGSDEIVYLTVSSILSGSFAESIGSAVSGKETCEVSRVISGAEGDEAILSPVFDEIVPKDVPFLRTRKSLSAWSVTEKEYVYTPGDVLTITDGILEDREVGMVCICVGEHCTVWGSKDDPEEVRITETNARLIADMFDGSYDKMTKYFGDWFSDPEGNYIGGLDSDGDGKLAIFCFDIENEYARGITPKTYTGGYFWPAQLLRSDGYIFNQYFEYEEGAIGIDCINIDTFPCIFKNGGIRYNVCESTLFHECQHLINYSYRFDGNGKMMDLASDKYMNEAFSMGAEHVVIGPDKSRVKYLSNTDYYNGGPLTYWTGSLTNYSNSYLFGQYLRCLYGRKMEKNGETDTDALYGYTMYRDVLEARRESGKSGGNGEYLTIISDILDIPQQKLIEDFWKTMVVNDLDGKGDYSFTNSLDDGQWSKDVQPNILSRLKSVGSYYVDDSVNRNTAILNGGCYYTRTDGKDLFDAVGDSSRDNAEIVTFIKEEDGYSVGTDGYPILSVTDISSGNGFVEISYESSKYGYIYFKLSNRSRLGKSDFGDPVILRSSDDLSDLHSILKSDGNCVYPRSLFYYTVGQGGEESEVMRIDLSQYSEPEIRPCDDKRIRRNDNAAEIRISGAGAYESSEKEENPETGAFVPYRKAN